MFPFNPNLNFKKLKIAKLKISRHKKMMKPIAWNKSNLQMYEAK